MSDGGWLASHEIPADRGLYGSFHAVADRNKKIILKVLDSIPSGKSMDLANADESNRHTLKAVYDSCLHIDRLDTVGVKPLLPLVDFVVDKFGEFDLVPAPDDEELQAQEAEWSGAYNEDYEIPAELAVKGEQANAMRNAKKSGRMPVENGSAKSDNGLMLDDDISITKKHKGSNEGQSRMTDTLAFLHSRGEHPIVFGHIVVR